MQDNKATLAALTGALCDAMRPFVKILWTLVEH